jgi:hypothetical protein
MTEDVLKRPTGFLSVGAKALALQLMVVLAAVAVMGWLSDIQPGQWSTYLHWLAMQFDVLCRHP